MTLTTTQAASLAGMTPAVFRRAMSRERARGRDYRLPGPDARTPLWDEVAVRAWVDAKRARPRKGAGDHKYA